MSSGTRRPREDPRRDDSGRDEPSREQLLAMAYADGELAPDARREFETLLETRQDLLREVAQVQRLHVLARQVAVPEPMDFEWGRLARDPMQRTAVRLGWLLLAAGTLGVAGWAGWILFASELGLVPKVFLGALLAGFVLLLLATLRGRLRTLRYDPYTEVQR